MFIIKVQKHTALLVRIVCECSMFLKTLKLSVLLSILFLSGCVTEGGNTFTAKMDIERALQTRVELGMGYLKVGDTISAKLNMVRALEIDPKSVDAHIGLAHVFQKDGEFDLAEKHFKESLSIKSNNSVARESYGQFLFKQKRYEDALVQYAKVLDDTLYEFRPRSYYWYGLCYLNLQEIKKAEENFVKVMSMSGDRRPAARELAKLYFGQEDYSQAKEYFDFYTQDTIKNATDLWMGFRIERIFGNLNVAGSYALALKNLYPYSSEYLEYKKIYGAN